MERRGFLKAILLAGVAPAFVRVESLMRIKPLVVPTYRGTGLMGFRSYILTTAGKRIPLDVPSAKPYTTSDGDRIVVEYDRDVAAAAYPDFQFTSEPLPVGNYTLLSTPVDPGREISPGDAPPAQARFGAPTRLYVPAQPFAMPKFDAGWQDTEKAVRRRTFT